MNVFVIHPLRMDLFALVQCGCKGPKENEVITGLLRLCRKHKDFKKHRKKSLYIFL